MYIIDIRNFSKSTRGSKYKIGVYCRTKLVEELGIFSIDTNGSRYLRVDFDRFFYYLSVGAQIESSNRLAVVLKQLLSFQPKWLVGDV